MGKFSLNDPKLADFAAYLTSIDGGMRSETTAREIATDVSKILFYIHPKFVKWSTLTETGPLLDFFELIRSKRITPEGRLQKMERVGDGHKYMRFCSRVNKDPPSTLSSIEEAEESLSKWKTILRCEKKRINAHRLVQTSNTLPPLKTINSLTESEQLAVDFAEILLAVERGRRVVDEKLRYAVAVPLAFASSTRPGAITNMTTTEYEKGRWVDDLYIVSVENHKTTVVGPCKVVFNAMLRERAERYRRILRPVIVVERGDVANFFVLLGH
jgi:hypothetical protein